jgi:putative transposase
LQGQQVNHKRVWRLYRERGLAVRGRRKARRTNAERQPLHVAGRINEVWSVDFVMDALCNGRRIKCLTIVDDFSRECVDIAVDHGIGGECAARVLDRAERSLLQLLSLPASRTCLGTVAAPAIGFIVLLSAGARH